MAWSRTACRFVPNDVGQRHRHADRPPPRRATRGRTLSIRQEIAGGIVTVVIAGELDLTTTPVLARHLEEALARAPRHLVIDLSQVTFTDVAAARLISGATGPGSGAGRPVLRRPSPEVRRVLELTGLDAMCEIEQ